jgi:hypothetical protein
MSIVEEGAGPDTAPNDFTDLVRANRVLGALPDDARAFVCAALEPVFVPAGQTVMRAGDPADCLYLVAAGRLRVLNTVDGEERVLAEIGRGDVVGEMALIIDRPRTADVVALRDTHLLRHSSSSPPPTRRPIAPSAPPRSIACSCARRAGSRRHRPFRS